MSKKVYFTMDYKKMRELWREADTWNVDCDFCVRLKVTVKEVWEDQYICYFCLRKKPFADIWEEKEDDYILKEGESLYEQ